MSTAVLEAKNAKNFDDKNYDIKLQIINNATEKQRINNFIIKIAKSEDEQERGLMFIDYLPKNYGMLFKFEEEKIINMWMKNTKISLDMIFIDGKGIIKKIVANTKPNSLEIISSDFFVDKVLEINGGLCAKLNIAVGNYIKYKYQ